VDLGVTNTSSTAALLVDEGPASAGGVLACLGRISLPTLLLSPLGITAGQALVEVAVLAHTGTTWFARVTLKLRISTQGAGASGTRAAALAVGGQELGRCRCSCGGLLGVGRNGSSLGLAAPPPVGFVIR